MKKVIKAILIATLLLGTATVANAKTNSDITFKQNILKITKSKQLKISNIIKHAKSYLGTRYRFGGTTRKGIDCSAFTKVVFKKNGKHLPRTSSQQASSGKHVAKKNLRKGDLVFFKGTYKRGISHVGIFLGNDKFIHASSGARKVTISKLSKSYYRKHYAGARRIS